MSFPDTSIKRFARLAKLNLLMVLHMQKRPASQEDDPRESPLDDPRQQTDQPTHKQTDKPWKGNPEKNQINPRREVDLEKWQESNTH